ncbi:MAG: rod-binding protein [Beijerinckiaceae bacterium]|nr:rod-binding protein [Beijerinckiaceae bacterium]
MSITPVSDIVLDVARAADPARARAAAERLFGTSASGQAVSGGFSHILAASAASLQAPPAGIGGPGSSNPKVLHQVDTRTKAYKGLEQLVLKNLVETMLPKDSAALFGSSTAGVIWRSMLAEQLASEIGKNADLGLTHRQPVASEFAAARTDSRRPGITSLEGSSSKNS